MMVDYFFLPNFLAAGALRRLNSFVRLVNEDSIPIRSRELAPTKPTTSVFFITRSASAGVLMGPPWHRKKMSFRTREAASMISWVRWRVKSQLSRAYLIYSLPLRQFSVKKTFSN